MPHNTSLFCEKVQINSCIQAPLSSCRIQQFKYDSKLGSRPTRLCITITWSTWCMNQRKRSSCRNLIRGLLILCRRIRPVQIPQKTSHGSSGNLGGEAQQRNTRSRHRPEEKHAVGMLQLVIYIHHRTRGNRQQRSLFIEDILII